MVENKEVLMRVRTECVEKDDETPYNDFPCKEPAKMVKVWEDVDEVLRPIDFLITQWSCSSGRPRFGRFFLEIFDLEKRVERQMAVLRSPFGDKIRLAAKEAIDKYFGDRYSCAPIVLAAVLTPQYLIAGVNQDQQVLAARLNGKAIEYLGQSFKVLFPERWKELAQEK